ncbi:MAG: hypothetical protein ACK4FZ_07890 [Vogesella sp.]|uniref:hypothetical protein n=1 Tax=Vogesella sp. TaxID=1904252 RepID=UPI00391D281C
MRRASLICALWLALWLAQAGAEPLTLCYHYGCDRSSTIDLPADALIWMAGRLRQADDAGAERAALQDVALAFYQIAAQTLPLAEDRGDNHEDDRILGRMDCIDHTHNLHQLLALLQSLHLLRYHQPAADAFRAPWLFNEHHAATVQDIDTGDVWVVDGWFRDFGAPPVVVPLALWKEGFSP